MDVPRLLSCNMVKCVDDFRFLTLLLFSVLCSIVEEPALPSVVRVETEQEREVTQQLKQANDTVARLRNETKERDSKISVLFFLV